MERMLKQMNAGGKMRLPGQGGPCRSDEKSDQGAQKAPPPLRFCPSFPELWKGSEAKSLRQKGSKWQ